jgi:hypothetical protein
MNKIQLELSARHLNTLVYLLSYSNRFYPSNRTEKAMKSILSKLQIKIEKKHCEVKASLDTLFSKPKKSKFTFEYHEADCLENYLLLVDNIPMNDHDRNVVLLLKNKLNQQLA